ncbi:hypothetical protein COO60DRAFT_1544204 [Scenedesmus sp. NREL 46B-D3]|nr:hypothetical protein COO60DRAFT_1544204 [Scenedesmus sp. NREL 46B-D3]
MRLAVAVAVAVVAIVLSSSSADATATHGAWQTQVTPGSHQQLRRLLQQQEQPAINTNADGNSSDTSDSDSKHGEDAVKPVNEAEQKPTSAGDDTGSDVSPADGAAASGKQAGERAD